MYLYVIQCSQVKEKIMSNTNSFRIKPEVLEKLKEIAKQEKRSLNNLVNKILSDFTDKK